MKPRFPIGLKFFLYSERVRKEREIVDIYTTRNNNGDIVDIEYICQHAFMGQGVGSRFGSGDPNRTQLKR